jgi:hypothetical protein
LTRGFSIVIIMLLGVNYGHISIYGASGVSAGG